MNKIEGQKVESLPVALKFADFYFSPSDRKGTLEVLIDKDVVFDIDLRHVHAFFHVSPESDLTGYVSVVVRAENGKIPQRNSIYMDFDKKWLIRNYWNIIGVIKDSNKSRTFLNLPRGTRVYAHVNKPSYHAEPIRLVFQGLEFPNSPRLL